MDIVAVFFLFLFSFVLFIRIRNEPELKEGETWYLIATRWYQQWEQFVQIDGDRGRPGPHPGPINNVPLLDPNTPGCVLTYMRENTDYVMRTEEFWKKLSEIYGGGPAIPRKVVASMWGQKSLEVFPLRLQFVKSSEPTKLSWRLFSKNAKIKEMKAEGCKVLGVAEKDVRVWDYHNDQKLKILEEPLNTLAEERILDGQKLLFEERGPDGKWSKLTTQTDRDFGNRYSSNERVAPGLCGLSNLGNTCFMNSGLQCLSNTVPLAELMVSGQFDAQVNRDNPLGTGGELVAEFADLLQDMWSGRLSSVAPRDFKWKLERFAPQFSGWQQHDSQELLAFLLDGMHEDLNRVKKKPYFETNEFEHLTDPEAAEKSWEQHIARNNSFITDWCHGLLRSEVRCNVCPRVSKTFDPFMYLTVPLPEAKTRFLEVLYWTQDYSKPPIKYGINAPKHGTILEFMVEISKKTGYDSALLQLCDVYSQRFFKIFKPEDKMSQITDRDVLYVFECVDCGSDEETPTAATSVSEAVTETGSEASSSPMEAVPARANTALVNVVVLFKEERVFNTVYYQSTSVSLQGLDPPLILAVPRAVSYRDLYNFLHTKLSRFFQKVDDTSKPLFQIFKGGRQAQFRQEVIPDDEIVELVEADHICIAMDTEHTIKGAFAANEAATIVTDPSAQQEGAGEGAMTLDQCINLFGVDEQLSEDDPWYCSKCKEHRRAFKKFDLWMAPKILIVHLKRFSYRSKHWREKIESLVHFPLEGLDLTPHLKGPVAEGTAPIYDLYAISNHYGALGGGHYTAFCKNQNDSKWYKFDDSSVTPVTDPNAVITSAAYVLFYQRRDSRPPAGFKIPLPARAQPVAAAPAPAQRQVPSTADNLTSSGDVSDSSDGGPIQKDRMDTSQ